MESKRSIALKKAITVVVLLGILFSTFYAGDLQMARALKADTEIQYNPLVSNSLFLYASTVLEFDIQSFLDQQNGPLKNYSEEIDGDVWTAENSIAYNAVFYGINPQTLLVLLDAQNEIISQADSQIPLRPNPLDDSQEAPKFYYYVKWLAETALISFDARREHQDVGEIVFESGETVNVPLDLNAGTYGALVVLANHLPLDQWLIWTTGTDPLFKQTFTGWFGNPMLEPDVSDALKVPHVPDAITQALPGNYYLPFPVGSTWYYTGGPHTYTGSGARPWSSIDIAPPEMISCPGGSYPSGRWIVAARGGTVITSQTALVVIDHGDGWRTYYSHVSSADRRGTGGINQGDNLGHPSCEVEPGGSTTGVHVHFAIYQVGIGFVNISGSSLSDWLIAETSHYNGTMTRQGVTRTATTGRYNGTNDIFNSGSGGGGSCPSPSLNNPSDGYVSQSQTVSFSWSAVSGCTFNGYTFRIKDTSNMDSGGNTIVDIGEGGTSRTETIGSQWNNRDLYWGVKAANAPNGASWSVRRFRIEPGGGGCNPNADQVALFADGNYSGSCVVKGIGDYPNPGSMGIGNDSLSSIKVGGNVKLTLCRDDNYNGGCDTFTGDDSNLGDNGIGDNQASSAKVEPRNVNWAYQIFDLGDYNGEKYEGNQTINDLSSVGWNDKTESIKINSGYEIIACEHGNFEGNCGRVTGPAQFSDINALAQGLRNGLSSIKVCVGACPSPPSAEFDAWPLSGNAPLTVAMHIVDMSNITNCSWNYGDGQTSTTCTQLHDHIYSNSGTYTVSLTVSGQGGSDSMTRNDYIVVSASGDSYEPDNSSGEASWISSGSPQTHSIIPATDTDWVKFQLNGLSAITIETTGFAGSDTRMWLYDSSLNQVEYSDDEGVDFYSLIDRQCDDDALPTGTYYVKIDEFGNDDEISSYDLSYSITQECPIVLPDLTISIIGVLPESPVGNEEVYVSVKIDNTGVVDTTQGLYADLYIDRQPSQCGDVGDYVKTLPIIPAGGSVYKDILIREGFSSGSRQLQAYVDIDCIESETNEDNNASPITTINVGEAPPAPTNDDFDTPVLVTTIPFNESLTTLSATKADDDPDLIDCNRLAGLRSIWYEFTPSQTGYIDTDTVGSNYDTMLAIWTGMRGNLVSVACNDDIGDVNGGWDQDSHIVTRLNSGTTYYIEVSRYNGAINPEGQSGRMTSEKTGNIVDNDVPLQYAGGDLQFNLDFTPLSPPANFLSIGTYDGRVLESGETSNRGGSMNASATTFFLGDDAQNRQYRGILSFNTAILPNNAVITKVTLKIRKQGLIGSNPFDILSGLKVDIRKVKFGTALNLQISDFQAAASKSAVGTFGKTPANNWYSANIGSTGWPYINLSGTTQFRLRFAKDDNNDYGADYMKFYSGNAVAYRPQLIIEYYVP